MLGDIDSTKRLLTLAPHSIPQDDGTSVCPTTSIASRPLHAQYIELEQANGGGCNGACSVPSSNDGRRWPVAVGALVATVLAWRRRRCK